MDGGAFGRAHGKLERGDDWVGEGVRVERGGEEGGGKGTVDQGVEFFVKEGYQSRSVGLVETKGGTGDPTYLYYTLGKLEIMKLREDYRKKMGAGFTIQ